MLGVALEYIQQMIRRCASCAQVKVTLPRIHAQSIILEHKARGSSVEPSVKALHFADAKLFSCLSHRSLSNKVSQFENFSHWALY